MKKEQKNRILIYSIAIVAVIALILAVLPYLPSKERSSPSLSPSSPYKLTSTGSCLGKCGLSSKDCYCDSSCWKIYGDCCKDIKEAGCISDADKPLWNSYYPSLAFSSTGNSAGPTFVFNTSFNGKELDLIVNLVSGNVKIPLLAGNISYFDKLGAYAYQVSGSSLLTPKIILPLKNLKTAELYSNIIYNYDTDFDEAFIASKNGKSYYLSVSSITQSLGINYTSIKDLATGLTAGNCSNVKIWNTCSIGDVQLGFNSVHYSQNNLTIVGGPGVTFNKIYDNNGYYLNLPLVNQLPTDSYQVYIYNSTEGIIKMTNATWQSGVISLSTSSYIANCIQNWGCTAWGTCIGGVQTRTCSDSNNCGNLTGKPSESQSCTVTPGSGDSNATYQGVLNMFYNCKSAKWSGAPLDVVNNNCNYICSAVSNKPCLYGFGLSLFNYPTSAPKIQLFNCSESTSPVNVDLSCLCCSV